MNFSSLKKNWIFNNIISICFGFIFWSIRFFVKKNKTGKIVIIALHKLGDSVFTIKAITEIIKYHNERIALICFPESTDIFKLIFKENEFYELDHGDFYFSDRIASFKAKKILKHLNPRIIYDLTGSVTSASLILSSSATQIIGTNEKIYNKLYTKFVPLRVEPHITDIYIDAIKCQIPISRNLRVRYQNNKKGVYILIHPFAGWEAKEWNFRKFVELAEKLMEKYETRIVLPPDRMREDLFSDLIDVKIKLMIAKSTEELISIIEGSVLLIGNDSGPIHIANLLDIPTFTIYGPTNPEFHKPIEGINRYIMKKIRCSPTLNEKVCFTNGGRFGCPSYECMNLLQFDDVYTQVSAFIEELVKKNSLVLGNHN